jgi:hypothetical protein
MSTDRNDKNKYRWDIGAAFLLDKFCYGFYGFCAMIMGLNNRCKLDAEPGASLEDTVELGDNIVRDIYMHQRMDGIT